MVTPSALPQRWLEKIRSSLAQRTGLSPQAWVLEARVRERMRATGIAHAERYSEMLAGRPELTALVELLRVGETRFFRHEAHMRAVTELVLPELRLGTGPARAWSAGCATGEEAYTLAMLLSRGLDSHRDVSILASDISPSSLQTATEAVYRETALATLPSEYRSGLEPTASGHYQVTSKLRKLVTFEERNLASGSFPGPFDLIFCRNVLIYFDEEAKDTALQRLVKALKPGAFLFLGYSESLRDVAGLEVVRNGEGTVYRKRSAPKRSLPRSSQVLTPAPKARPTAPRPAMPFELALRGEYPDGIRLAEELGKALALNPALVIVDLDGAEFLGPDAAEVLRRMRAEARSSGTALRWQATREGHLRFLRRHELHAVEDDA